MPSTITNHENISDRYVYLKDAVVGGETIEVWIDPSYASFIAYDKQGSELKRGQIMDEVIQRSGGVLRRRDRTVTVPFKDHESNSAVATGKHRGTNNVIIKYPGRKKEQIDDYEAARCWNPETPDDVFDRLAILRDEIRLREAEQRKIHDEWSLNLIRAVSEAINAKVEAEDEAAWKKAAGATTVDTDDEDDEL